MLEISRFANCGCIMIRIRRVLQIKRHKNKIKNTIVSCRSFSIIRNLKVPGASCLILSMGKSTAFNPFGVLDKNELELPDDLGNSAKKIFKKDITTKLKGFQEVFEWVECADDIHIFQEDFVRSHFVQYYKLISTRSKFIWSFRSVRTDRSANLLKNCSFAWSKRISLFLKRFQRESQVAG